MFLVVFEVAALEFSFWTDRNEDGLIEKGKTKNLVYFAKLVIEREIQTNIKSGF